MKKVSNEIKKYSEERGWDNLLPADLAKSISIEANELLELFQWENFSKEEVKKDKNKVKEISKEVADVMIYCFEMAHHLDFDMEKAVLEKLEQAKKKYPVKIFNKHVPRNDKKTQELYLKIKKKYRKGK
jgi:NTP pyrophosphatase (non-canonical NTP hydrolase)